MAHSFQRFLGISFKQVTNKFQQDFLFLEKFKQTSCRSLFRNELFEPATIDIYQVTTILGDRDICGELWDGLMIDTSRRIHTLFFEWRLFLSDWHLSRYGCNQVLHYFLTMTILSHAKVVFTCNDVFSRIILWCIQFQYKWMYRPLVTLWNKTSNEAANVLAMGLSNQMKSWHHITRWHYEVTISSIGRANLSNFQIERQLDRIVPELWHLITQYTRTFTQRSTFRGYHSLNDNYISNGRIFHTVGIKIKRKVTVILYCKQEN